MASSSVAASVWNIHHNTPVGQGDKDFSPSFIAFYGAFTYPNNPYEWWSIRGSYGVLTVDMSDPLLKLLV
jgi:hypothetical protein